MTTGQYVRLQDRTDSNSNDRQRADLELSQFAGVWLNTNSQTRGIAKVSLAPRDGHLNVRVFGADGSGLRDWGETTAEVVYGASMSAREGMAFVARYDLGFQDVLVGANLNQGLLVIALYNTFRDRSGRSNYFAREFFFRA